MQLDTWHIYLITWLRSSTPKPRLNQTLRRLNRFAHIISTIASNESSSNTFSSLLLYHIDSLSFTHSFMCRWPTFRVSIGCPCPHSHKSPALFFIFFHCCIFPTFVFSLAAALVRVKVYESSRSSVVRVCEANMWSFRAIGRSIYFLSQSIYYGKNFRASAR